MQNKDIAQLVLQKIKQKKQEELKNTPHYKILQQQATFSYQYNAAVKKELAQLQQRFAALESTLLSLEELSEQLDFTGKRDFPRIIVKPQFIASENVEFKVKEFYRKLSNTFLRLDFSRKKNAQKAQTICCQYNTKLDELNLLERKVWNNCEQQRKQLNAKRRRVLKQKLRLQGLNSQIDQLKQTIMAEREDKIELVKEFELKNGSLENRKQRLRQVQAQIQLYKKKLEQQFTPAAYRQHLTKIYALQTKNEIILHNLRLVNTQIRQQSMGTPGYSFEKKNRQANTSRMRNKKMKTQSQAQMTNDRTLKIAGFGKMDAGSSSHCKVRFRSEQSQFFGDFKSAFLKQYH